MPHDYNRYKKPVCYSDRLDKLETFLEEQKAVNVYLRSRIKVLESQTEELLVNQSKKTQKLGK